MKTALAAAMLAFAVPAFAQTGVIEPNDPHKGTTHSADTSMQSARKAAAHKASGVVTKVDAAKKKVTIKHGAVPTLNWPAMTMAFTVKDKAVLQKLQKDKKVDFEFVEQGKDYVITSVE